MKRVKRRYLALLMECSTPVNARELSNAIWDAITRLYGEYGASQTGLKILDFNEKKQEGIIRVSLVALQQVRASLSSITKIAGKESAVHVISISGTVKSLRTKALSNV